MTIGFGANKEIFNHSIFLVLCNRLVTCALAIGYLAATRASVLPAAPLQSYAAVSLTNVVATSCQYEALYYVSFAVQTLAKSAKALPVMLWGGVYNAKKYRPADYVHALVITLGCSLFLMTGKVASRTVDNKDTASYMIGSGLMLLYLAVDGLTSTWQDAMFSGYHVGVCDQVCGSCRSHVGYMTGFYSCDGFYDRILIREVLLVGPGCSLRMRLTRGGVFDWRCVFDRRCV